MYCRMVSSPSKYQLALCLFLSPLVMLLLLWSDLYLNFWSVFYIIHQDRNPTAWEKSLGGNKNLKHIGVLFHWCYFYYIKCSSDKLHSAWLDASIFQSTGLFREEWTFILAEKNPCSERGWQWWSSVVIGS